MSRRAETLAPSLLALLAALSACCHSGCGSRNRPAVLPPPHVEPAEPAPVATPPRPAEEIGGFLAREHAALVGVGAHPVDEPWAPPGEWVAARNEVQVWVPRFVPLAFRAGLIVEVETTLPRHDRLYSTEPNWVGPKPGTRIVILPGAFQSGSLLAAGLTSWDSWHEQGAVDLDADVLYLAWRPQASGVYLPALAHELAHSWSRSWLGEGPPGAP